MQSRLNSMESFRDRLLQEVMNSHQLNISTVQAMTRVLELLKGIMTKYNVCLQGDDFEELMRVYNEARNFDFI